MKQKMMTRATAFLLAFLMVCTSIFTTPANVQAATKATKITLSATKKTLSVNKSFTLKVKSVSPGNASKAVTYKSSDKKVATVNAKGKVTAKQTGKATITVTSKSDKKVKAKCVVTVKQGVEEIQTASALVMQKGKSVKLNYGITPNNAANKKVKFSSNKKSVATVSSKGVIKAKKAGSAKITVKSKDGGAKATVKVTVKKSITAVSGVTLNKTSLALGAGSSEKLTASVSPSNAAQKSVYWVSSNTSVAKVGKDGTVTAVGNGTASVTAYATDHSGKNAVCTVTVTAAVPVTGVTVKPASLDLAVGETSALTAVIAPENATNKAVTWSSSNESVAAVSANGAVTAKAVGTAAITVTTEDGKKTASCQVTVSAASSKPQPVFDGNGSKYEYGHFTTEAIVIDANSEEKNPNASYSIYHIMDYTKDVPYADSYDANGATNDNNTASMYVITSGNNALLIDMGNGAASTAAHFGEDGKDEAVIGKLNQEFRSLVLALVGGRNLEIAISHQHGDHVGYSSAMQGYKVYYPEGDVNDRMIERFKDYDFTTFTPGDAFKIKVGDITVDTLLCAGHTNASTIYVISTPVVTYNADGTAAGKYMVFSSDAVGSGSSVWLFTAAGMKQFNEGIDAAVAKLESYNSYNAGTGIGTKTDATIQILGGHGWQYENRFGTMSMDISYVRNMKELIHKLADIDNWRYDGQEGKTLEQWMEEGYVVLKDVRSAGRYTAYYGNPKTSAAGITGPHAAMLEYAGVAAPVFEGNGSKYEYGHFTTEAIVLNANSEEKNPNASYSIYHIMDYTKEVPYADSYDANGATDDNNTASMYVITSGNNALLIDMGNGAASTASHFGEDGKDAAVIGRLNREFHDLITALVGSRNLEIAISHQHGDHVGYSSSLSGYKVYYPEGDVNDRMRDRFKDYDFTTFTPGDNFKIQVGDITVDTILCAGHTNASTIYVINTPVVTYNADGAAGKYMVLSSDAVGSGSSVWLFTAAGMKQFNEGIDAVVAKLESYNSYNAGTEIGTKTDATIQILGGHGWQYENRFGTMSMDISYVRNMKELIHKLADTDNWRYDGDDGKTLEQWMEEGYVVLKDVGSAGRYTAYYGNPKTSAAGITGPHSAMLEYAGKPTPTFKENGSKYEYGHFTTEAIVLNANSEEKNPNASYSIYHIMDYTKDVPYADSYDANGATNDNNTASMYVITSGDNALLIDMGNGAASTASHFGEDSKDEAVIGKLNQEFRELVEALVGNRKLEIAISHQHGDHVGYSSAMEGYKVYYPEGDVNDNMRNRFKDYDFTLFTPGDAFKIKVGDITVDTVLCAGHTNASTIYVISTPVVTYKEDGTAAGKYMVLSSDAVGSGSSVWLFSAAGMKQFNEGIDAAVAKLESYNSYNAGTGIGTKTDATIQILGGHGWQYENRFGTMSMDISYVRNMKELIHKLADTDNWRYDGDDGKTLEQWMEEGYVVLKDVGSAGRYTAYYGNPKTSAAGITGPHSAMLEYAGTPVPTFRGNGSKYEYGHFTTEAIVLNANSEEKNPNASYSIYHIMDYTKEVPYADSYDANGATDDNNTASMYVITTDNNALLIDMGNGAASTAAHFGEDSKDEAVIGKLNQEFRKLVEALVGDRKLEIAISHQHGDHVGYSSAMKEYKVYYPEGDVNDSMRNRFKDYTFTTFTPGDAFKIKVGDITVDTILCAGHTNASTIYVISTPVVTYKEDGTAAGKYMVFSSDAVGSGSSVWLFSTAGMKQFNDGIDAAVAKLESYNSYNAGTGIGTKTDATIQILGGHGWQYENRFGTMSMDISYVRNMKELIHKLADTDNWRYDGDEGKTLEQWMEEGYVVLKDVGNFGRYTAYYGNPKTSAAGITGPHSAMLEYATGFGEGEAVVESNKMKYRLYSPSVNGYKEESYPLVLFLHGEDGIGTDNKKQLTANDGAMLWVEMADSNPAYVLAPQINTDDWTTSANMELVMKALNDVLASRKDIDKDRIYVQGMSMGGTGTWKLLLDHPDVFAAGMPICGKVPAEYYAMTGANDPFKALANMPIWAFHTADDTEIPASETAKAVKALQDAGSKCIKYEEFTAGSTVPDAHAVWERVYEIGTPYNWLMMQSRTRTEDNTKDPSMLFSKKKISDTITRVCDYELGQVFVIEDKGEVLIIDSAMGGFGAADLYGYIKDEVLVNKDAEFDLVLTHNHVDHILGIPSLVKSGKLKKIYIHENDKAGLMSWLNRFDINESYLADIKEDDILTVAGKELEVVETPAHTKGSICLFYEDYIFTGDAVGSGDLWLLGEYSVRDCVPGIQHLIDEIDAKGKDFELLTGHAENKHIFTNQYAKDILSCVKGIVDGSIDFGVYTRRVGAYATYGSGNIFFQENQINTLETEFSAGEATVGSSKMAYRLYDPSENGYEEESYPLVLFLHGEDGMGTDNDKQLTANDGAKLWVTMADSNPAYVLAPQINTNDWTTSANMDLVMKALNDVLAAHKDIDTDRIYVQGMSMGGTGTWKMLLDHPDVFAAGMPICGEVPAEYYEMSEENNPFKALANMPIWAFHTADDDVVSADETAKAVKALKDAGSKCIKYEEFSAGSIVPDAHAVWDRVYEIGTPYNWLMMQSRTRTEDNTKDPSMQFSKKKISDTITRICDYELGQVYVIEDKGEVLIIDSAMGGMGAADLYAYIKDEVLVNKDAEFELVLTHNHGDHTMGIPSLAASGKLKKIYIHENDRAGVLSVLKRANFDESNLADIKEGESLTVGGKKVEVIETPAHTKGSICLFYEDYIFTGDAVGSGDLWLLGAMSVKDSVPGIQHLVDEIDKRGKDFELLTGHAENKYTFTNQYAKDILSCVKGIVDRSIDFGVYTRREGAYATYGSGNIFFQENQIDTLE